MLRFVRAFPTLGVALALCVPDAQAQISARGQPQAAVQAPGFRQPPLPPIPPQAPSPAAPQPAAPQPATLISAITLADIGFGNGIRFANLGGRREIFVPLPQGVDIAASELLLSFDDLSAHESRRNVEILVNDRSAAAIVLDGRGTGRIVRVPLGKAKARDGFLKLGFLYSGAATQDRCIDVRYVGDSLTIRPDTAVEVEFDPAGVRDVATIAALMPRDIVVTLPNRRLTATDLAVALTVARSLAGTGRRVTFASTAVELPELVDANDRRRWTRGIVVIGAPEAVSGNFAPTFAAFSGSAAPAAPAPGTLGAIRVGGLPALLVSDAASARAGRLLGNPLLAATRGLSAALVGEAVKPKFPIDRVSFDQLGLALTPAEIFGRAELSVAIDIRTLPPDTQASRLLLDIMVAPDGAGEKAVVSIFVNERLLTSAVAANGEATRLDLSLPDGLIGTVANIRALVQRRSAQGDCRFEPQGYPAQILGSSAIVLTPTAAQAHDFSDLVARWANGVEVLIPASSVERLDATLGLVSGVISALTPETAPISVKLTEAGSAPTPAAPFLAVNSTSPAGAAPRVRFDRGRVAVADRAGRTLLDLGGFTTGAVAQIVTTGGHHGLWIKPLAPDGTLPTPPELHLNRGDVAFVDKTGVALAMSTERDTLIQIAYPDQVSWMAVAERFRSWIVGGLWLAATIVFLFLLQRMLRRRRRTAEE